MGFIWELSDVEAYDNKKLHVIHTNDLQKVKDTVKHYEQHLKYQRQKIVGVDVKFTNKRAHEQKVALVQLFVGKTQLVLLFQLSITEEKSTVFDNFLNEPRYTFVGFCIDEDIDKLDRVGLEIGHFVNIQKEFRVPENTKYMNSLGDASNIIIDDYYTDMKHKMTDKDHRRRAKMPLFEKYIEYVAKDTYATYEIGDRITITQDELRRVNMYKSKKRARTWGHYG
ncbi:hypothetical protein ZWY2020_022793 [Hordeum vulgare]|nr:hypothetical protein ZWY2020_022793 [Hordeum vulgare]